MWSPLFGVLTSDIEDPGVQHLCQGATRTFASQAVVSSGPECIVHIPGFLEAVLFRVLFGKRALDDKVEFWVRPEQQGVRRNVSG